MTATDLVRRTYAWTGTPNASPSVQRDNGATVRTNLVADPAPSASTWASSVGAVSVAAAPQFTSGRAASAQVPATGGFYVLTNVFGVTGGVTYFVAIEGLLGSAGVVRVTVRFRNGSGAETYLSGPTQTVSGSTVVRLTNTVNAPSDAVDAAVFFDVQSGGNSAPAFAGSAYFSIAPGLYFDGGTAPVAAFGDYVVPLTTTLATATGSTVPLLMLEHETVRTTQHTVHEILGRSDPDVTFGPTQTRSGSMTLLYETLTAATTARDLFAAPGAITLTQTDLPQLSMQFVVPPGDLAIAPDQEDADLWTLTLPFREVIA